MQENTFFDHMILDSMSYETLPILHHMTYAPAKIELATLNSLGADALINKKKHYLTLVLGFKVIGINIM